MAAFLFGMAWRGSLNGDTVSPQKIKQIQQALEAASTAGTNPCLSSYHVRTATIIEHNGEEHLFTAGNTEYLHPEAIHSEVALVSQVIAKFGKEVAREKIRFIAFYGNPEGSLSPCGDCRDYLIANTNVDRLLEAVGEGQNIIVRKFKDCLVDETTFAACHTEELPVTRTQLKRMLEAAMEAKENTPSVFTPLNRQSAAAAISETGAIYRAAGVEDGAFHYRTAIGSVLQQAVTENDHAIKAILVVGKKGVWPSVSYRERQYGYEFSGLSPETPLYLILTDRQGNYRCTTFDAALPNGFRLTP